MAGYEAAKRLYAKRKPQIEKTEKTKEDYEFERMGNECTFAPNLIKGPTAHRKNDAKTKQSERQQETFNKQLERQKKAREEKERIKQMMERGVPTSTAKTPQQKLSEKVNQIEN